MQPIPKHSGPCSFAKPCSACWKEYERKYFERVEKMKADRMAGLTLKQIGERYGLSSACVLYHVGRGTARKKPCSGPCSPEKLCSVCHSRQYQQNYRKGIKGPNRKIGRPPKQILPKALKEPGHKKGRPPQQIPTLSEVQIEEMKTAKRNEETLQSIGMRYGVPRSRVRDFIGKIRKQRKRLDPRQEEMKAMRASGMTLQSIGDHFQMTGEAVRKKIGNTGRLPRPSKWPRAYFEKVMKKWLWDAGYRRCSRCGIWTSEVTTTVRVCRACGRENAKKYHSTAHGRQKLLEWKRNNPERVKAAIKRWQSKHVEYLRERQRKRYRELVATPEGRDKIKKRDHEYYLRKKAKREGKAGNEEKTVQQESDGE